MEAAGGGAGAGAARVLQRRDPAAPAMASEMEDVIPREWSSRPVAAALRGQT